MYLGKLFTTHLAVEGFFILSGFLLAQYFQRCNAVPYDQEQHPKIICEFLKNKFARLYPEYLFALFLNLILDKLFIRHVHTETLPFNLLMITDIGRVNGIIFGSWFLATLMISEWLLFALMVRRGRIVFIFHIPFAVIAAIFLLNSELGQVVAYERNMYFNLIPLTLVRALLGISVGCLLHYVCDLVKNFNWNVCENKCKILIRIGEVAFLILCLKNLFRRHNGFKDFNIYFYFSFLVALFYFRKEWILKFMSMKIWESLSRRSYMLYLTHGIMLSLLFKYVSFLQKMNYIVSSAVVIVGCIVFACAMFSLQKKVFSWLKSWFRPVFSG
jgi:peptidoglycan/LPS O-acetylase OafA/YrhL